MLLFLFYFLGGYLLYSSLFAAIGAAVDSETDTQQFMFPITIPMMIAIFIAQTASVQSGWASGVLVLDHPVHRTGGDDDPHRHGQRLRTSVAPVPEHVLLVGTFIFTTWLAGRIYRTGILMYGKKVSWKELGKWLFYKG